MKIRQIDHFVITTADLDACLRFYTDILGMEHRIDNGHHNLYFPGGKISVHRSKGEFQPAAAHPEYGAQDFCLEVQDDLAEAKSEVEAAGVRPLTGIVLRHGARGAMQSFYLRDPDGNLVELCRYP